MTKHFTIEGTIERIGTSQATADENYSVYSNVIFKTATGKRAFNTVHTGGLTNNYISAGEEGLFHCVDFGKKFGVVVFAVTAKDGESVMDINFLKKMRTEYKKMLFMAVLGVIVSFPMFFILVGFILLPYCLYDSYKAYKMINALSVNTLDEYLSGQNFDLDNVLTI